MSVTMTVGMNGSAQREFAGLKISQRTYRVTLLGLFLLAALLAFSNTLKHYFLSDDFVQIGKVIGGDNSVAWGRSHGGFFRPLFILSYVIDNAVWGARPFGFHLTNVTVHALNSFLTFLLSLEFVQDMKLDSRTRRAVSIGAAALFLLHPSHTEAVTWISGRADLLATFFSLASILFYLRYTKSTSKSQLRVSIACFTLALLAKEAAICVPFILLAIGLVSERAQPKETLTRLLKIIAPFALILVGFVLVRSFFIGSIVGGYGVNQHLNFSPRWLRDRLLEASVRSVLPSLPAQWSFFLFKPLQSRLFILIAMSTLGLVAAAIVFRRRRYDLLERETQNRFLLMLVTLFLVSLLPVISLRLSLYQTLGERFLYLPSVFSCLLISYLSAIFIRNFSVWLLILVFVLGFYSTRLYQTNRSWGEAAQLSQSIANDITNSATRERVLVLNVPDNLRGVPVFHNGLPEALQYFQNRKGIRVEMIAFQNIQSVNDEVALSDDGEFWTLRAVEPDDTFDRASSKCLEGPANSRLLRLSVEPCLLDEDVFFFSEGRMTRLPQR